MAITRDRTKTGNKAGPKPGAGTVGPQQQQQMMQQLKKMFSNMSAPKPPGGGTKTPMPKLPPRQMPMPKLPPRQMPGGSTGRDPAEMQQMIKKLGNLNMPMDDLVGSTSGSPSRPQRPMRGGPMRGGPMRGGPMPGGPRMKAGGKVEGMKSGGKVRGAGIARKGVRPCKMR
jgi:hypothetical protein